MVYSSLNTLKWMMSFEFGQNFVRWVRASIQGSLTHLKGKPLIIFSHHSEVFSEAIAILIIYFNGKWFCSCSVYQWGKEMVLCAVVQPLHHEWVAFHGCTHFLFSCSFLSSGQLDLCFLFFHVTLGITVYTEFTLNKCC